MSSGGVILANSSALVGNQATTPITYPVGSRACVVINALAYPAAGSLFLQMQGPSGAWINVNSGGFTADTFQSFDLPAGQYRLSNTNSSAIGVNAVLCNILY